MKQTADFQSFMNQDQFKAGPTRQIFGRQDRHSGGHITAAAPLPCFILQNPGKSSVLTVLPSVVALLNNLSVDFQLLINHELKTVK